MRGIVPPRMLRSNPKSAAPRPKRSAQYIATK